MRETYTTTQIEEKDKGKRKRSIQAKVKKGYVDSTVLIKNKGHFFTCGKIEREKEGENICQNVSNCALKMVYFIFCKL